MNRNAVRGEALIPEGWQKVALGEFMQFKNGINADKSAYGQGTKFVNVMDIFRNSFLKKDDIAGRVRISDKQSSEYSVIHGDVLFNRTSETREEIAYSTVYTDKETVTFGGFVIRGRQKQNLLSPAFAGYCFKNETTRKEMIRRSQGAVRANIGQKDLNMIPVLIPPKHEQEKIVQILSRFDSAIEKTEALITAKQKRFEWLKTSLINRRGYRKILVSDFIFEISSRNHSNQIDRVLSVTNRDGFVLSEDQFERRVASANLSNYKIIERGQYAYNPSRINVGSIARLDYWNHGILSPMYVVFGLDCKKVDSDYFLHWLSSSEAKERVKNSVQGSVRDSVSFGDLGAIQIALPDKKIQKSIAYDLNLAQKEIILLMQLVEKYHIQKRGLMQKLLTGRSRLINQ